MIYPRGLIPVVALIGGPLERGTFFKVQVYKRVGISPGYLKCIKGWGNLSFRPLKVPKSANRDTFFGCEEVKKTPRLSYFFTIKDSAFTAVQSNAAS